jgi:hypothetical protein
MGLYYYLKLALKPATFLLYDWLDGLKVWKLSYYRTIIDNNHQTKCTRLRIYSILGHKFSNSSFCTPLNCFNWSLLTGCDDVLYHGTYSISLSFQTWTCFPLFSPNFSLHKILCCHGLITCRSKLLPCQSHRHFYKVCNHISLQHR